MCMEVVAMVTDLTIVTLIILLVLPIWEVHNHLVTTKETMHIDTNPTQRGVQVEMVPSTVVVVQGAERAW